MPMRPYETRYWTDNRRTRPTTSGFPKAETGSIDGAVKAAAKGLVSKVQCIDRENETVLWTVKRGAKLPGRNLWSTEAHKGDPDMGLRIRTNTIRTKKED